MMKYGVTKFFIVPVVIRALGMVSKSISKYLKVIGFDGLEKFQNTCFLETARIKERSWLHWLNKMDLDNTKYNR